jgi:hypothetical protein
VDGREWLRAGEREVEGWHPGPTQVGFQLDSRIKAEGRWALAAVHEDDDVAAVFANCDLHHLPPGARVRVSARVRGEDLDFACVQFLAYAGDGTILLHRSLGGQDLAGLDREGITRVMRRDLGGTFDWALAERVFDVPRSACRGRLLLNWRARGAGRVWLDDARVEWIVPRG